MYLYYNFPALSLIFSLYFYMFGSQFLLKFSLKMKVCALPMFLSFISGLGLDNSFKARLFKAKHLLNTRRVRIYFIEIK